VVKILKHAFTSEGEVKYVSYVPALRHVKEPSSGLNGCIPVGGHVDPISFVCDSILWKNAQKNDTKKRTSVMINRIMPHRSPSVTIFVCIPW
jgi:hypothetical protein